MPHKIMMTSCMHGADDGPGMRGQHRRAHPTSKLALHAPPYRCTGVYNNIVLASIIAHKMIFDFSKDERHIMIFPGMS